MPPVIVRRLTEAHEQITASPEFRDRMAAAGLDVTSGHCGDSFLKKMTAETNRWAGVVKATGFVVN